MAAEEAQKNQEIAEASDSKKEGKGGLLKFILIPVILLAQGVGAYFLVFNVLVKHPNHESEPVKKKPAQEVGQFYEINDIVVNPAGTGGKRYLVMAMGLEAHAPGLVEEAQSKEIWVRDAVITILAQKSPEQLLDFAYRKDLKKEILTTLNNKMQIGKFEKLYFKKYILQ